MTHLKMIGLLINVTPCFIMSNQSVWAFQLVTEKDRYPVVLDSVILPMDANIESATDNMANTIWQKLKDHGYAIKGNPPKSFALLELLNDINYRTRSFFVVKIYPPSEINLQSEY